MVLICLLIIVISLQLRCQPLNMLCKNAPTYKYIRSILFSIAVLAGVPLYAQSIGPSAIDAAGNSITTGGITYEYAIGQPGNNSTFTSASLVVTPGVLQPVINTTGILPDAGLSAQLQVYPDPLETMLFIQPAFKGGGTLQSGLYDASGKLVLRQDALLKTGGERQALDVTQLAAGNYLLQVKWLCAGATSTAAYKLQKLR